MFLVIIKYFNIFYLSMNMIDSNLIYTKYYTFHKEKNKMVYANINLFE